MILDEIIFHKRQEVTTLKLKENLLKLEQKEQSRQRDFFNAINKKDICLIAEIKKASPSAGVIREVFEPVCLAQAYEGAGACAISVLTDEKFFQGSIEHLKEVKAATKLPVLRKDFIIDESQIYESKSAGADAILLISTILSPDDLVKFVELAHTLKMDCLVEVHSPDDVEKALQSPARIIGINNRDLNTFKVNLNTTFDLITSFPKLKEKIIVSESGIKTKENVDLLRRNGVNSLLIGETLLQCNDIEAKIKELFGG